MARTPPPLLAPAAVEALTAQLPGWEVVAAERLLRRTLAFPSFSEAFAFVTRVALLAERLNHHPDIHLAFRRVTLVLTTHDAGGLTELDAQMAARINQLAGETV